MVVQNWFTNHLAGNMSGGGAGFGKTGADQPWWGLRAELKQCHPEPMVTVQGLTGPTRSPLHNSSSLLSNLTGILPSAFQSSLAITIACSLTESIPAAAPSFCEPHDFSRLLTASMVPAVVVTLAKLEVCSAHQFILGSQSPGERVIETLSWLRAEASRRSSWPTWEHCM
jgi:hypothetical protein